MTRAEFETIKARADALEARIARLEHRAAILAHWRKHRVQTYLRGKLGKDRA